MGKVKPREDDKREELIQKAIKALQGGLEGGVPAAVEIYGIPRTTLYYRLSGARQSRVKAHEDQQRLTEPEEKAIVKFCFEMDDRGFPPRLDHVKDMALNLEQNRIGKEPGPMGKNWISRFLNRHPALASKYSTLLERQRAYSNDPRLIKDFFIKLGRLIRQHGLKAFQIFNMDEKGFLMGQAARAKVLCRRGRRNPRVTHDGKRELVTVVESISAAGQLLSPLVVNKGKGHYLGWYKNLTDKERDYKFSYSPRGWIDDCLAMMWLENVFEPETSAVVGPLPRLLIVDGHGSHITYQFIEYCIKHNILLFCLPSHSTHLLQPLDVGLFSPYQHFYGRAVDDYMRSGQNRHGIKKSLFIPFLSYAREQAFSHHNICQAFEATGIWPLSARKVLLKMAPESEITARRDTIGLVTTPRQSRDIRRRVQAAGILLDQGLAGLTLTDNPPTSSDPDADAKRILHRVKGIMRDLGHQLETTIAERDLYKDETRKLQGVNPIYNQVDGRKLSEARFLSAATLMELRDKRLRKDALKAAKGGRKKLSSSSKDTSAAQQKKPPRTPISREVIINNTPMVMVIDSDDGNTSWSDSDETSDGEWNSQKKPLPPKSPKLVTRTRRTTTSRRLIPDRPLHMSLRSHKPSPSS